LQGYAVDLACFLPHGLWQARRKARASGNEPPVFSSGAQEPGFAARSLERQAKLVIFRERILREWTLTGRPLGNLPKQFARESAADTCAGQAEAEFATNHHGLGMGFGEFFTIVAAYCELQIRQRFQFIGSEVFP
jgi:hypothetical protein